MAIARVAGRVKMGGHSVPADTIDRRYYKGLSNFFDIYKALATTWRIYDASNENGLTLIAHGEKDFDTEVLNPKLWKLIKERVLRET
jgi:predicted ABC-type ATPase